jgi:hypothetical protein
LWVEIQRLEELKVITAEILADILTADVAVDITVDITGRTELEELEVLFMAIRYWDSLKS